VSAELKLSVVGSEVVASSVGDSVGVEEMLITTSVVVGVVVTQPPVPHGVELSPGVKVLETPGRVVFWKGAVDDREGTPVLAPPVPEMMPVPWNCLGYKGDDWINGASSKTRAAV